MQLPDFSALGRLIEQIISQWKYLIIPSFFLSYLTLFYEDFVLKATGLVEYPIFLKSIALFMLILTGYGMLHIAVTSIQKRLESAKSRKTESQKKQRLLADNIEALSFLNSGEIELIIKCLNSKEQTFTADISSSNALSLMSKGIVSATAGHPLGAPFTFKTDIWRYMMSNRDCLLSELSEKQNNVNSRKRR